MIFPYVNMRCIDQIHSEVKKKNGFRLFTKAPKASSPISANAWMGLFLSQWDRAQYLFLMGDADLRAGSSDTKSCLVLSPKSRSSASDLLTMAQVKEKQSNILST